MHVGLVGNGPAVAAARASVEGPADQISTLEPDAIDRADLAIVVGPAGSQGFLTANNASRRAGTAWIAVELGGIGGQAIEGLAAAVSGFSHESACFRCLRSRVKANAGDSNDSENDRSEPTDETGLITADERFSGAIAGREAARLITDRESSILGGIVEVPYVERRLLPVPGCECDSSQDGGLQRHHSPRELESSLAAAETALDPRVGIIREVGEVESFPAPYYLATLAHTSGFSDASANSAAAGVATDWNQAFMKALGEALERYAAGVYRAADFEQVAFDELQNAIPPSSFVAPVGFDDSPDEPIRWAVCEHLGTGEVIHVPLEVTVFPPPEIRLRPSITTGLGLGNGGVEALLSGIYEVVERDAAILAWYSSFEPLGLEVSNETFLALTRRARSEDLHVTTLLLTQDVDVPVVATCVHRSEGDWPRFAAGMSADLDPVAAAIGALEEALQNWMELRGMGREKANNESGAIGYHADFPAETQAFVSPETTVPATAVGPEETFDGPAELDEVVTRVSDAGLDPYGARLTPRDVESIGFEAVRVIIPSAQPLFAGTAYFGKRAETVPRDLGFEPWLDRQHHPFP